MKLGVQWKPQLCLEPAFQGGISELTEPQPQEQGYARDLQGVDSRKSGLCNCIDCTRAKFSPSSAENAWCLLLDTAASFVANSEELGKITCPWLFIVSRVQKKAQGAFSQIATFLSHPADGLSALHPFIFCLKGHV